jgi:hypothetical protein
MADPTLKVSTEDEAMDHLLTKLKYDLVIKLWDKLVALLNEACKDRVSFVMGKEQRLFPANLVKAFTNVDTNPVFVSGNYNMQELANIFEILMHLPGYKCSGVTHDYADWKPISSLVNMTELASKFGMEEVETFLKRIPDLLTEHNKNAYRIETWRREENKEIEQAETTPPKPQPAPPTDRHRRRTKQRSSSLARLFHRSLSRSKKPRHDED